VPSWSERQAELAALAQRQLFFVGGAPRSGTTWVQHILDSHPDVSCRGEGHFLNFLAEPMDGLVRRRREDLEAKNNKLFKGMEGYPLPAAGDFEFLVGTGVLLALSQQTMGRTCLAVGEKTPENVFYFPNLKRLFPGAKFIGVARDPRDILTSAWHLVRRRDAQGDETEAKSAFLHSAVDAVGTFLRALLDLRRRYPADAMIVTYEDLTRTPDTALGQMFRFLGVTDAPEIVTRSIERTRFTSMSGGRPAGEERSGSFFRKGVAGDWVTTLTPEQSAVVVKEIGWMFAEFGWRP
jgi:hypothetical protein